ncbi:MAG TPA: nodulation protein NfeD [Candidatus Saccharimonadales bacterium]|nr:nodulation protein NfeD [Candidatus Saccharimonadales bacterium]
MKRLFPLLIAFSMSFAVLPTTAQVLRIHIDGTIHPIAAEQVARAVDAAQARHASALLIQINTPGGLLDSTREIIAKIESSTVPVIIYVGPSGARAASAAFFILQSGDVAAMANGTNTGAAHPVTIGGGKLDDVMKTKIENDTAAFLRSYVSRRGHNAEEAEKAVRQSISWTEKEALDLHLIDITARDEADLLKQLDGRTLHRFDGSTTILHVANQPVEELPSTLRQRVLGWLMDPNIAFLVLAIGALSLYAEFNHPGAIIPGVVGVIFILLTLFALNLLPTRYASLALIGLAFVLFALEAKFVSHGILTLGGIVALTLGGVLLVDGPIPEMRVKLLTSIAVSLPFGLITAFLMSIAWRARRNKIATGSQGIIGELGIARSDLAPHGKVFVHGELWDAHSAKPLHAGAPVRVVSIHQLELEVEPIA